MAQQAPSIRMGFGQSSGGHITLSHCAMADCGLKERERKSSNVVAVKWRRRSADLQSIAAI